MSDYPGRAKDMLEASTHTSVTIRDDAIVATCSICGGQRTFRPPACLWDVLDMMALHHRSNHR